MLGFGFSTTSRRDVRKKIVDLAIGAAIAVTKDGSVGQTYSTTLTAPIQWYRKNLVSGQLTAISGATSATYVTQAADSGYRLVVTGKSGGKLHRASALQVVLTVPIMLHAFNDTTAYAASAGNLGFASDTTTHVQGASGLQVQETGASNRLLTTIGSLTSLGINSTSGLGVIALYVDTKSPISAYYQVTGGRLDQTTGNPASTNEIVQQDLHAFSGGRWAGIQASESAGIAADDPTQSWRFSVEHTTSFASPYRSSKTYDALMAKAGGRPTVVIGFDDGIVGQYSRALPEMQARNIRGTWYLPTDIIDANAVGRMSWSQTAEIYAAGMDMQVDGTPNDVAMTTLANPAAAISELKRGAARVVQMLGCTSPTHFCYPNGLTFLNPKNPTTSGVYADWAYRTTATSDGSNVVVVASAAGIAVGMRARAYGTDAIVTAVSGTSITLSTTVAAFTARPFAFFDDSGPFFLDKLQEALRTDGTFKTGRANNFETYLTRFGFGEGRRLLTPAYSMSNGSGGTATDVELANTALSRVDKAISRGSTVEFYIHDVIVGATGVNTPLATFQAFLDGLVARRDAGQIDILTKSQLWQRDSGSGVPI